MDSNGEEVGINNRVKQSLTNGFCQNHKHCCQSADNWQHTAVGEGAQFMPGIFSQPSDIFVGSIISYFTGNFT